MTLKIIILNAIDGKKVRPTGKATVFLRTYVISSRHVGIVLYRGFSNRIVRNVSNRIYSSVSNQIVSRLSNCSVCLVFVL